MTNKSDKQGYQYKHYRLLVMGKAPELGKVKTRMQPQLTQQQSLELHSTLTQQVVHQWIAADICPIDFWVGGNMDIFKKYLFEPYFKDYPITLFEQVDGDLGNKMSHAVETAIVTYQNTEEALSGVILLGTDCPYINRDYLIDAITALEEGSDIVIGPAEDGGYVLLGLNQYYPELFINIDWGSDKVYQQTRQAITHLNLSSHSLPCLFDVDCYDDLKRLNQPIFSSSLRQFASMR